MIKKECKKKADTLKSAIKLWNKASLLAGFPFLIIDPNIGTENNVLGWIEANDGQGFLDSTTKLPEAKFRRLN